MLKYGQVIKKQHVNYCAIITLYYASIYGTKPVVLTTRSSTHEYKVKA